MKEAKDNIKFNSYKNFIINVFIILAVAIVLSRIQFRVDLTEDNRYTLSDATKKIFQNIDADLYVQVFLDGDMPIALKKMKRSVKDMLDEFKIISKRKIDYEFINPLEVGDAEQRDAYFMSLYNKGLNPINIQVNDEEGGKTTKMIFPGMLINYNGAEVPINILSNNWLSSYEENIQHSIEGLEYELAQTISTVTSDSIYKVAFIEGEGELYDIEVADISYSLSRYFTIDRGVIGGKIGVLDDYSAIIIAKPENEFTEQDKFVIDQYLMNGGKAVWLIDEVHVSSDTLAAQGETLAMYQPLNIEDMLFRYGARINPEIIQDLECQVIRLSVFTSAEQQQMISTSWIYNPMLVPSPNHPITRNINRIRGEFANSVDTVGLDPAIKKTILLTSSTTAKTVTPPMMIRYSETENLPDESQYAKSNIPVAILLEGVFPSAYKNRMTGQYVDDPSYKVLTESVPTKMIVIGDGDIIRNDVEVTSSGGLSPLSLSQDNNTGEPYGNRDFLVNSINYLVNDNGLMDLRSREVKLRLLDKAKIRNEKLNWQLINVICPILIVVLAGIIYNYLRRLKWGKANQ